ncbi:ATP-binding protein [Streptomyces sp. NPDC001928]|uniref:ATP-binding protein n=1 Tax=Streptomyces sp. NPDC001928 TaxID=3154404 RepID=UPI00332A2F70
MNAQLGPQGAADEIRAQLGRLSPTRGFLYLDGPSGTEKSRLLQHFADSTPGALLVDAAGCTVEEVADHVMRAINIPYGDYRSSFALYTRVAEQDLSHIVLVTNTQWAGKTRSTDEPLQVATGGIVGQFGRKSKKTGIKFIVEVDSEVYDLSPRNPNPILLTPAHDVVRLSPNSLPPRQHTAMTALALSEPHRVRFEEWQALCSALGTDFDVAELRGIGEESPFVTVEPTADLPVGFTHERDARTLREGVPADTFQASNRPSWTACSPAPTATRSMTI